jgi:hypothetical protein
MPLRSEYTLHQSDLNEFLAAPVWKEVNGAPLSVLSALARLDMDPWAEAAHLAGLPRDAAVAALTVTLRRLPKQGSGTLDAVIIADRLVAFLPKGGSITPLDDATRQLKPKGSSTQWLLLVLAALLFAFLMSREWF